MVVVVAAELEHTVNMQEVHIVEVLVPIRDLSGPPTRVVSISIWCICWRHHVGGCTHPRRVSIVPHKPICIRFSLHWVLIVLLSLLEFHLITIQPTSQPGSCGILILTNLPFEFLNHWSINPRSNNKADTKQHRNNPTLFFLVFFLKQ